MTADFLAAPLTGPASDGTPTEIRQDSDSGGSAFGGRS